MVGPYGNPGAFGHAHGIGAAGHGDFSGLCRGSNRRGIPQYLSELIVSWDLSAAMFLIAVNVLLLLFGIFMEPLPDVMILAPIAAALGFQ